MEQIIVTHIDGSEVKLLSKSNASKPTKADQTVELNGVNTVDISVESAKKLSFSIGDKINIYGRDYTLNIPAKERKISESHWIYDLQFEGVEYDLLRCQYNVNIDTTGNIIQDLNGSSLTGDLAMFLNVLVSNANRIFPNKWSVGVIPSETETKTLTFGDEDTCLSVLQTLCGEENYNKEFDITIDANGNRTINVGKVGAVFGHTFEYGKGKGVYELTREKVSSTNIVNRLFVYGGSKNIVTTKYRADRLCLPGKSKSLSYLEDAASIAKFGVWEGTKVFEDVFPKRTGTITALGSSVCSFVDSSMDFDLNERETSGETKYLLAGQSGKIKFNTGKLAGFEFEISKYDHATKTFTVVKQTDENDYSFPSETLSEFKFAVGDKYVLIDIYQPQSYISNAESEVNTKGTSYLNTVSKPLIQYGATIDKMFLKSFTNSQTGNIFWVGDYIPIKDADFDIDKSIRIKGFTRNLLDEYDYKLTVSDFPVEVSQIIRTIENVKDINNIVRINNIADPARARRNYKATSEIVTMLETIKAEAILIGNDPAAQFELNGAVITSNVNGNPNSLTVSESVVIHNYYPEGNPGTWTISAFNVSDLVTNTPYRLYIKASKSTQSAIYVISSSKIGVEDVAGYYHFPVGILSSVIDGARIFQTVKGYTLITGDSIKTGTFTNKQGQTVLNLDTRTFYGSFTFSNGDNVQTKVTEAKSAADTAQTAANNAQTTANNAASAAATAQTAANGANAAIADMSSDDKITPIEKQAMKTEWDTITSEKTKNDTQADAFSVSKTAYGTAYTALSTTIGTNLNDLTTTWDLGAGGGTTLRTKFKTYYDERTNLLNAIASKAKELAEAAQASANQANSYINSVLPTTIAGLQNQIDGVIDSWFYAYTPSLSNIPASDWTTDAIKDRHIGDTFTNTQPFVDNTTTPDAGKSWRFVKNSGVYSWTPIADSDAVKALQNAAKAQDTADSKRRTFTTQPTNDKAYDVGDFWSNATYGTTYSNDLLKCKTAKAAGAAFDIAHWEKATKYTDDTAVNNLQIGGRNLLPNSRRKPDGQGAGSSTYNPDGTWTITDGIEWNFWEYVVPYQVGEAYTLSIKCKRLYGSGGLEVHFRSGDGYIYIPNSDALSSNWTVLSVTRVIQGNDPNANNKLHFHFPPGSIQVEYIKIEKGNKPTDWTPAPEDVDVAIADSKQAGLNAQDSANTANSSVSSLNTYVDGAFKDGVIDTAEAKAIDKLNKQVNTDFDKAINDYNVVYANTYLTGSAKTDLLNSKVTLAGAKDNLQTSINTAIADGKTTTAEKADVDSKFTTYKNSFTDYQTKLSNANKAIQQELDRLAEVKVDAIQIGGRNLVLNSKVNETSNVYRFAIRSVDLIGGQVYTLSFNGRCNNVSSGKFLMVYLYKPDWSWSATGGTYSTVDTTEKVTFTAPSTGTYNIDAYYFDSSSPRDGTVTLNWYKVEKGNKATDWTPAPEDVQASIDEAKLSAATAQADATLAKQRTEGRTVIDGGVVETNIVTLGTGGIAGMSGIPTDSSNNPLPSRWTGGTYAQAIAKMATIIEWFNGDAKYGDFWIDSSGSICIKDANGVNRVVMTRSDITTLAAIANSTQNTTVSNSEDYYSQIGTKTFYFVNNITVNNNNSTVTIQTALQAQVAPENPNQGQGMARVGLYLNNISTGVDVLIASAIARAMNSADTTSVGVNKQIVLAAGTYRLKAVYTHTNYSYLCNFYSKISASTTTVFFDGSTQRTEIGKNGIGIIGNALNFSSRSIEEGVFKVVEKTTGVYDVPGVLAAGNIASSGANTNTYGAKVSSNTATKGGVGQYYVPHNVGSAAFTAIVTPVTDSVTCMVVLKNSTQFVVYCRNASDTLVDASFEYLLVGRNS